MTSTDDELFRALVDGAAAETIVSGDGTVVRRVPTIDDLVEMVRAGQASFLSSTRDPEPLNDKQLGEVERLLLGARPAEPEWTPDTSVWEAALAEKRARPRSSWTSAVSVNGHTRHETCDCEPAPLSTWTPAPGGFVPPRKTAEALPELGLVNERERLAVDAARRDAERARAVGAERVRRALVVARRAQGMVETVDGWRKPPAWDPLAVAQFAWDLPEPPPLPEKKSSKLATVSARDTASALVSAPAAAWRLAGRTPKGRALRVPVVSYWSVSVGLGAVLGNLDTASFWVTQAVTLLVLVTAFLAITTGIEWMDGRTAPRCTRCRVVLAPHSDRLCRSCERDAMRWHGKTASGETRGLGAR